MAFSLSDFIASLSGGGSPQMSPDPSLPTSPMSQVMASATAPQASSPAVAPSGPQMGPPASAPALSGLDQYEKKGILSDVGGYLNKQFGVDQPDFLSRFGNALAIAGSQDPYKALMMYRAQNTEDEKNRAAIAKANRGETKHIKGALFGVYAPDGTLVRTFVDPVAGKYEADNRDAEAAVSQNKTVTSAVLQELVKKEMERFKGTTDAAGGAVTKPEFSAEVQRKVDNIGTLIPKVEGADTLPGGYKNPVIANAIDQTWGRVANTADYETRRKLDAYLKEGVLADVKTLGANPSEGDRKFMEKKVPTQDDPTSYKVEYLTELKKRLEESENRRVSAAQQRDSMGGSSVVRSATGQSAPPPSEQLKAAVTAAGIAFEPDKYQYRIGPNGQVQRKAK